jgi:hypothetical protein
MIYGFILDYRMGGLYTKYIHIQKGISPSTATRAVNPSPTETQSISRVEVESSAAFFGAFMGKDAASGVRESDGADLALPKFIKTRPS